MRLHHAAEWIMVVGLAVCSQTSPLLAQGPPGGPPRPQSKIIVYQPQGNSPTTIAVMGEVASPGTYEFPAAPTLNQVIKAGAGLTPTAAPVVRIVRGNRVAIRAALTSAGQEKLQTGDLVILDRHAVRDFSQPAATTKSATGVQLALLGVVNRPIVVLVRPERARVETIIQMLGQSAANVGVIPAPQGQGDESLASGSVLVFDPRRIDVAQLPDDLPKVMPCGLSDFDIGGYGIDHAIDQRQDEPGDAPAAPALTFNPRPQPDGLSGVPLPGPDANLQLAPTPLPDTRISATFSSTDQPATPVSRVPFSPNQNMSARPTRLVESAPTDASAAPDTLEPSWDKVASPNADAADAEFTDPPPMSAKSFPTWQIASILLSAVLVVGLAVGLQYTQKLKHGQASAPMAQDQHRIEPRSSMPTPHISAQRFASAAEPLPTPKPVVRRSETLEERRLAFEKLMNNQFPILAEPLALRPGSKIGVVDTSSTVRRIDIAAELSAPHHLSETELPMVEVTAASDRRIIDAPHQGRLPTPHLRIGTEARLERALRQLQGGHS